jgi:hypothetical protein
MAEMLMAMSIMAIIGGAVAVLSSAVQTSNGYSQGVTQVTQHGRVAAERIVRAVSTAAATEDHPGCVVIDTYVGTDRFPDTLVVWRPRGAPVNPQGPPLVRELVIYCVDPADPRQFVEITAPLDSRPAPFTDLNTSTGRAMIEGIKTSTSSTKVVLTGLLRVSRSATYLSGIPSDPSALRGCVRFQRRLLPSASQWASFRSGSIAWDGLDWPQGIYGSQTGLRQAWLTIELQLMPQATPPGTASAGEDALPWFGSAALFYELRK